MFRRSTAPSALAVAVLTLGAGLAGLASASPAAASAPNPWPAHVFAPYADTWSGNITLSGVANSYGTKFFTIAFADGRNCQWSIGQQASLQSQIDALRGLGGDVSLSFGGYGSDSGLTELGDACSSPQAAAAQIESAITTFNLSHVDFDIEANSLTNSAGVDRRNKALAQIRSWASASGRRLSVSVTLPASPSGLGGAEMNVLTNGRANGFTPDVVNLMTMDYATAGTEMGNAAGQAVDAAAGQVANAFGISSAAAYAKLGDTPMIGQNDSAGEVFTLADAATVEAHDASRGIALLSYWSQNRDNGGCAGSTAASGTCSGISQNTGDFARAFQGFTSNGASASGQVASGISGKCLDVNGGSSANGTAVQIWGCNGTAAQQWSLYSDGTLRAVGKCLDATGFGTANGTKVEIWDCNGGANQVWQAYNGGYRNPLSGRCLDDPGFSSTDGTQLDIWDCNGGVNQHWTLP